MISLYMSAKAGNVASFTVETHNLAHEILAISDSVCEAYGLCDWAREVLVVGDLAPCDYKGGNAVRLTVTADDSALVVLEFEGSARVVRRVGDGDEEPIRMCRSKTSS
jgi:hypothetical protein